MGFVDTEGMEERVSALPQTPNPDEGVVVDVQFLDVVHLEVGQVLKGLDAVLADAEF